MRNLVLVVFINIALQMQGQAPNIEWQNTIGGNSYDDLFSLDQTTDGGYILGGYSNSGISGDKTEASMIGGANGFDYWIVKINSFGSIVWQNTIGGNNDDWLRSVRQTQDGGYIVGGYSATGISGDKTEASAGGKDYWIIKLDSIGNIIWQNTIGGNLDELLYSLEPTSDGGYIVGGISYSSISGDKTENNQGISSTADYWVIKLDSIGNIIWQNTIGGTSQDYLYEVKQTPDNGYILCGLSYSGISGDKSEPTVGGSDYWIIKLDEIGNIEWQNTIGGTSNDNVSCINLTSDGGYIVGGGSRSLYSGDKTETTFDNLTFYDDYWILKLDASGNIEWQNDIGGDRTDFPYDIMQTNDGGYLVSGYSGSASTGDKTEGVIGGGTIYYDFWVLKLDAYGGIIWQNTIGGNNYDLVYAAQQTPDGGFILGGHSYSGISGDKTEPNMGASYGDYWVVKIEGGCIPIPEICNALDENCNGLIDEGIVDTIAIYASGPTTFCQGGNVLLTAVYSGVSLQWKKNGVNILGATSTTYNATTKGTYSCETASDCGYDLSDNIYVNVKNNPSAIINPGGPTSFCLGGSVVLSANSGAGLSYQWYKGPTLIVGATSINYTATTTGNYKCRVTKISTGCFKISNVISVAVLCKDGAIKEEDSFLIYPNPNHGVFSIRFNSNFDQDEIATISVLNILSEEIYVEKFNMQQGEFVKNFELIQPSGIYFIKLNIANNQFDLKIVIE